MCKVKVHKRIGSDASMKHSSIQIPHTTVPPTTKALYPLSLFSTQKPSSTLSWLYGIVPKHFPFFSYCHAYTLPPPPLTPPLPVLLTFSTLHIALPLSSSTSSFQHPKIFKIRLTGHWAHKYCDWMCVYEILLRFFPILSPYPSSVFIKRESQQQKTSTNQTPSPVQWKQYIKNSNAFFTGLLGILLFDIASCEWRGENIYIPPLRNNMMMICRSREGKWKQNEFSLVQLQCIFHATLPYRQP